MGLFYENEFEVENFGCAFSYMSHRLRVLLCFSRHTGGKEERKCWDAFCTELLICLEEEAALDSLESSRAASAVHSRDRGGAATSR